MSWQLNAALFSATPRAKYRAIKLICNRVIHAFESVCRYTLDLLYKRKIKRQLKAKIVASLK
jgi:hypothetical protein